MSISSPNKPRLIKLIAVNLAVFVFFAGLVIVAGGLWLTLVASKPGLASVGLFKDLTYAHYFDRRNTIQWMEDCARYDAQLTYTLRPGNCTFANSEFEVEIEVNSAGLRDDELSLQAPEMIVLGDSFAMGWGVGQKESFPEVIEESSGMRVLNAGISSYSTIREMVLLDRLDISRLKYLVIQYSDNDFEGNSRFLYTKVVTNYSERDYMDTVKALANVSSRKGLYYNTSFFARYLYGKLKTLVSAEKKGGYQAYTKSAEAEVFIEVLKASRKKFDNVELIVLELSGKNDTDSGFIRALPQVIKTSGYASRFRRVALLDTTKELIDKDYFLLDEHINASGHKRVADMVLREISAQK